MMMTGVLDGMDSRSNRPVAAKCVEWKSKSGIDSTLPCCFASMQRASMQRAGKFGVLANSCKDRDRSYSRRYSKFFAWRYFQQVGDLLIAIGFSLVGLTSLTHSVKVLAFFPLFLGIVLTCFLNRGWSGMVSPLCQRC